MPKTVQERVDAKIERYVASLTEESEAFGLIGGGFPTSLYKLYVRPTSSSKTWWKFEVGAGPSRIDPIAYEADLEVKARATAIWCPVPHLANYEFTPEKTSIGLVFARAKELAHR